MTIDRLELSVTSKSEMAANACVMAMQSYVQRKRDVMPQLLQAIELDPECAMAHVNIGLMMHGAKHLSLKPKVKESLANAKQFASGTSDREQLYIKALQHAHDGQLFDSVSCYESILEKYPTDMFALSLCQSELFWLGEMERSLKVSESLAPHWNSSVPDYTDYLAVRAFDLEESGRYKEAENAGREAVAIRSSNIWATHAVAHVLYMQGRADAGIEWIGDLQNNWQELNQMQFHLWWHKSLFLLENKAFDHILDAYDSWIRNRDHELTQAMPDLYIDLQNGASMLWRLEQAGVDVGLRWNEMAEVAAPRLGDHSNPFTSAHFAVILAAVGDFDACQRLVEEMQDFAAQGSVTLAPRYEKAGLPAAIAAIAHRRGQYQKAIDALMPARTDLWMMGGSHAQQDLFYQILIDSAAKIGDTALVQQLLQEVEQIGFVEPAQRIAYEMMLKEGEA